MNEPVDRPIDRLRADLIKINDDHRRALRRIDRGAIAFRVAIVFFVSLPFLSLAYQLIRSALR